MQWGAFLRRFPSLRMCVAFSVLELAWLVAFSPVCVGGEPRARDLKTGQANGVEPKAGNGETVGNPEAPGLMALLKQEIRTGLRTRGIEGNFQRFVSYTGMKLDSTAGYSNSEVTGNCRLSWYDHLMRHPLDPTPLHRRAPASRSDLAPPSSAASRMSLRWRP